MKILFKCFNLDVDPFLLEIHDTIQFCCKCIYILTCVLYILNHHMHSTLIDLQDSISKRMQSTAKHTPLYSHSTLTGSLRALVPQLMLAMAFLKEKTLLVHCY